MLLGVDDSLGRILAVLEKTGALDNTIVVFTSDHGYFYGEHGLNEERRLAYEETIRIPLLVRYPPRIKAGTIAPQMVLTIDLAPTLLELAGLTPAAAIEGRSLSPIFAGTPGAWRESFLVEYYSDTVFPRIFRMGYSAVRTSKAKYIEYRDLTGMDELYDLEADPYEEHNLLGGRGSQPALLKPMQEELQRLVRR
jgi:N-acetylglucosamine-6-sulfatase